MNSNIDLHINRITNYFPCEEKETTYFKIYFNMQLLEPMFSLNDLLVLRNLLTRIIDCEQKAEEIKEIINFKNKG